MDGIDRGVSAVRIPGVIVDHSPTGDDVTEGTEGGGASLDAAESVQSDAEGAREALPVESAEVPNVEAAVSEVAQSDDSAPAEKRKPVRSATMAAHGQPLTEVPLPAPTPMWPAVPLSEDEVYVAEEFDVTDLTEVSRQINRARARLFRVSQQLKVVQRTLAEAQSDYDRSMRRELVSISGGTEASRRAMAEIRCEPWENRIVVGKQIVEEWRKRAMDCRDDLKAIENIAHNVRAQIDIR